MVGVIGLSYAPPLTPRGWQDVGVPEPTAPHFPPPPPDAVPAGVPEDAAASWNPIPGGPPAYPEPDFPPPQPPRRRRPRWLPLLVTALTLVLIASGLFVADQVGRTEAGRTVDRYLPADGASWSERIDSVTATGTQSDHGRHRVGDHSPAPRSPAPPTGL